MLKIQDLEKRIRNVHYEHLSQIGNGAVTVCHIELDNGFVVTGTSGSLNPQIFDEKQSKVVAYENAFEQLWELFGFLEVEQRYRKSG